MCSLGGKRRAKKRGTYARVNNKKRSKRHEATTLTAIPEKKPYRRQRGWGKIKNEQERGRVREGDGNRGKEGDGVAEL